MKYIDSKGNEVKLQDPRKTGTVMGVWSCLGCMPSRRMKNGKRVCGHTEDTSYVAPVFNLGLSSSIR